jgi:RNA polymerase sigma-70 factor, ECF subfamily
MPFRREGVGCALRALAPQREVADAGREGRWMRDGRGEAAVQRDVAAAQRGDREAMHALYVRFAGQVHRRVLAIVRDRHEAEDVTQQVFAKLLTQLALYRPGPAPFEAWMLRVARNVALDHVRRGRPLPSPDLPAEHPATDETDRDRAASLREALATLPESQRSVLVMHHLLGLSPAEIATRMGRSVHSVHCLHNRGRAAARVALNDLGSAPVTSARGSGQTWQPGLRAA